MLNYVWEELELNTEKDKVYIVSIPTIIYSSFKINNVGVGNESITSFLLKIKVTTKFTTAFALDEFFFEFFYH